MYYALRGFVGLGILKSEKDNDGYARADATKHDVTCLHQHTHEARRANGGFPHPLISPANCACAMLDLSLHSGPR